MNSMLLEPTYVQDAQLTRLLLMITLLANHKYAQELEKLYKKMVSALYVENILDQMKKVDYAKLQNVYGNQLKILLVIKLTRMVIVSYAPITLYRQNLNKENVDHLPLEIQDAHKIQRLQ